VEIVPFAVHGVVLKGLLVAERELYLASCSCLLPNRTENAPGSGSVAEGAKAAEVKVSEIEPATKPFSDYEYAFDLVTALGTLVVALLAVFGDRVRAFLARPRLEVTAKSDGPHVELVREVVSMQSNQAASIESLRVRLCIRNAGRSIARSSRVVVDQVYRTRNRDTGLSKEDILPRVIPWPDDDRPIDLVPGFPYFVDVACVKQDDREGERPGHGPLQRSANHSLYLAFLKPSPARGGGEYYPVGDGRVVFPVTIFSENMRKPARYFVSIYWDGKEPKDHKENGKFEIEVLSPADAKSKFKELS
jgi:hypothetical protein